VIAFPLAQRPEGAPTFAPPDPELYGALRRSAFHGSAAAALAAHDAWEGSSLARRPDGPLDRPGHRPAVRAILVAMVEGYADEKKPKPSDFRSRRRWVRNPGESGASLLSGTS